MKASMFNNTFKDSERYGMDKTIRVTIHTERRFTPEEYKQYKEDMKLVGLPVNFEELERTGTTVTTYHERKDEVVETTYKLVSEAA